MKNSESGLTYPIRTGEGFSFHDDETHLAGVELTLDGETENVLLLLFSKVPIKSKNPLRTKPLYYDVPFMKVDESVATAIRSDSSIEYESQGIARIKAEGLAKKDHMLSIVDIFDTENYQRPSTAEGVAEIERETLKRIAAGAGATALAAGVAGIIYLARRKHSDSK